MSFICLANQFVSNVGKIFIAELISLSSLNLLLDTEIDFSQWVESE